MKHNLTISQKSEICLKYNGVNRKLLAKEYSVTPQTISNILKKQNIRITSSLERSTTHSLNKNYFENVDTEQKAYWLGFIAADGNIFNNKSRRSKGVKIDLSIKDLSHLRIFQNHVGSSHEITYFQSTSDTSMCRLRFVCADMARDLEVYNIVPNKTFVLEWPKKLNKQLYRHFIRGYFDGDGCVSVGENYVNFNIVGASPLFLEEIQNILIKKCKVSKNKIYKKGDSNAYRLFYGGRKMIRKIKEYLYEDATIYLDRKKQIFDSI